MKTVKLELNEAEVAIVAEAMGCIGAVYARRINAENNADIKRILNQSVVAQLDLSRKFVVPA